VGYRRIRGYEYLQAIGRARPFTKTSIQAAIIAEASENGLSMNEVLRWDSETRTRKYKEIVDESPDIVFMPRFTLQAPSQENYSTLIDAARPDRAYSRLDAKEMDTCANYVVGFLARTGFMKAFKEVVVTGSVPESMASRGIGGQYSVLAGSLAISSSIAYRGGLPGEQSCEPFLFVNALIMRRSERDRYYILTHEVLHYLLDHLHNLLLDEPDEKEVFKDYFWIPQALGNQTDELLRESLVEAVLLHIHGHVRPLSYVTELLSAQPALHPEMIEECLRDLPRTAHEELIRRLNVECFYNIVVSIGSYWMAGEAVPGIVSDALGKLPAPYAQHYQELALAIPSIVSDTYVSAEEFSQVLDLALKHAPIVSDIVRMWDGS